MYNPRNPLRPPYESRTQRRPGPLDPPFESREPDPTNAFHHKLEDGGLERRAKERSPTRHEIGSSFGFAFLALGASALLATGATSTGAVIGAGASSFSYAALGLLALGGTILAVSR